VIIFIFTVSRSLFWPFRMKRDMFNFQSSLATQTVDRLIEAVHLIKSRSQTICFSRKTLTSKSVRSATPVTFSSTYLGPTLIRGSNRLKLQQLNHLLTTFCHNWLCSLFDAQSYLTALLQWFPSYDTRYLLIRFSYRYTKQRADAQNYSEYLRLREVAN
jgi:hypothetical protein